MGPKFTAIKGKFSRTFSTDRLIQGHLLQLWRHLYLALCHVYSISWSLQDKQSGAESDENSNEISDENYEEEEIQASPTKRPKVQKHFQFRLHLC